MQVLALSQNDKHYSDVTWASWRLKARATRLFVQQVHVTIIENSKPNITSSFEGNPPVTGGFTQAQGASMIYRHHGLIDLVECMLTLILELGSIWFKVATLRHFIMNTELLRMANCKHSNDPIFAINLFDDYILLLLTSFLLPCNCHHYHHHQQQQQHNHHYHHQHHCSNFYYHYSFDSKCA